ncbi:O-antigen ligase family protein [Candidatus Peregrinibacteria bacterium]|nr:O-antigen ligase family protein [Candidatus Peregrinibacteria bacterium]
MRHFENILLWILRLGLAAALFSPLVYSGNYFFPYIVPRAFYFQIIAEILLAATVTLIAFFPQHRPRWNILSVSLVIYLGIAVLTTLTSADITKSFFGTIERSFGSFHLLHYGMLFFAAIVTLKNQREWNALFTLSLAIALYAALDLLIPIILTSTTLPPTVAGNPIFLAAYLIFHTFFAAHLLQQTNIRWLKILLGIIIAVFAAAILTSGVRGAFIGLSAAIAFLLIFYSWQIKRFRIALIGGFLVFVAAYGFIFTNRDHPIVKNNFILSRITDFSLEDATTKARFAMWKMALKGFQERPFFGWGRENYSIVFNTHYDPSFDDANVSEGWEDRTHNIFLEELTYGGIIGLLSYILILTATFYILKKNIILFALLVGYIVQNLFGVDNLNEHIPFFLLLAYSDFKARGLHNLQPPSTHHSPKFSFAASITATSLLAIILVFFFFTWKPAAAIRNFRSATLDISQNNIPAFKTHYQKGKTLAASSPYLQLEGMSIIMSLMINGDFIQQASNAYLYYSSLVVPDMAKLAMRNPAEQRWIFFLAKLYQNQAALTRNISLLDEAQNIWNQLVSSSPERKNFREAYEYSQQLRAAITAVGSITPTSPSPHNPSRK